MGFEASALLWWDTLGSASVAQVTIGNSLPFQGQEPHEAEGGTPGAQVGAKTLGQPAFVDILCQSQAKDWARGGPLGSGPSRSGQRVWGASGSPLRLPGQNSYMAQGPPKWSVTPRTVTLALLGPGLRGHGLGNGNNFRASSGGARSPGTAAGCKCTMC